MLLRGSLSQLLESLLKAKRMEGNAGVFVFPVCHALIIAQVKADIC
jgi:hypothetical protein